MYRGFQCDAREPLFFDLIKGFDHIAVGHGLVAGDQHRHLRCFCVLGLQGPTLWAVTLAGLLMALVVPHLLALRFGGVTGDVMGASIQLVEVGTLVTGLGILTVFRLLGVGA